MQSCNGTICCKLGDEGEGQGECRKRDKGWRMESTRMSSAESSLAFIGFVDGCGCTRAGEEIFSSTVPEQCHGTEGTLVIKVIKIG